MRSRRRRTQPDTVTKRVERAEILVCLGEISAARHALEGSPVAPGTEETLNALRDVDRRPPLLRGDQSSKSFQSSGVGTRMSSSTICEPHVGEQQEALRACATSICAHFSTMLRIAPSSFEISKAFAQAKLPEEIVFVLRMGQKANGGIRGIVVGDVIRRLVAKTLAKQFVTRFEDATKPFQYALSTRAGCESIAHVVQVMTDRDPNFTVLSIDGVGAFDLVSRRDMMTAVHSMDQGEKLIPSKTRRVQSTK